MKNVDFRIDYYNNFTLILSKHQSQLIFTVFYKPPSVFCSHQLVMIDLSQLTVDMKISTRETDIVTIFNRNQRWPWDKIITFID